jgi:glycosyltransferase involved in cell wall biosynthesis
VLSVVVPARDPIAVARTVPARFPWADEVVVQGGPGGASLARNNGAAKAHGDVLVFTDDDAELLWLEPWTPTPFAAFWVGAEFQAHCEDPHTRTSCAMLSGLVASGLRRIRWLASIGPFIACRREVFVSLGGFRRAPQDDTDFGHRAARLGYSIAVAPVSVHVHREFSLKNPGMAIEQFEREARLPVQDGPAIVVRPTARFPSA